MASVNPYLIFDGNCEEALDFYKSVFGGEFTTKARFSEAPPSDRPLSEEDGKRIMHVSLPIGNDTMIMASDQPPGFGSLSVGNNFNLAVSPDSVEDADRVFSGLAAGGQVIMPMEKTFWGSYFGMLKDKFGIHWMVDHQLEPKQ
jgi:PhnB protein